MAQLSASGSTSGSSNNVRANSTSGFIAVLCASLTSGFSGYVLYMIYMSLLLYIY